MEKKWEVEERKEEGDKMEGVRVETEAGEGRGHIAIEELDIASPSSASQWTEVTQVASPGCLRPSGKKLQSGDTSRLFPFTGTFLFPPP